MLLLKRGLDFPFSTFPKKDKKSLQPDLDIRRDGQITANNVKALRAEIEKELLGN